MQQRSNSVSPEAIQNITKTSVDQPNRSCKIIRNGKFWLIVLLIILLIFIISISIISVVRDDTIINPSSTITTTITSSTTNKIEESSVINCITNRTKWKQNGTTVVMIDNFSIKGIYNADDDQSIYITDFVCNCVLKWEYNATSTQIVAGANGEGNRTDQLSHPLDVIVDKTNDSIIICDRGNYRVMRWPRQNATNGDIIISKIRCHGLAMDNEGFLYVVHFGQHEVRRWKIGDAVGTIVAGGNERENHIRQFNDLTFIFVDQEHTVYVSDSLTNRVMKWMKGEKEGVVVAGGEDDGPNQFWSPSGIFVDSLGDIYVADLFNYRVLRWIKGATEGSVVVGGNGCGDKPNQFSYPRSISFDRYGNLYIVDLGNRRIQRFDIDSN